MNARILLLPLGLSLLMLLAAGCSDKVGNPTGPSSSSTGQITGTFRDSATNAPIAGAFVALYSATDTVLRDSTSTGANGNFTLDTISPKLYWIVVNVNGYESYLDTIRIQAGSNIQLNIRLQKNQLSASFTITVESALTGGAV